MGLRRIMEIVNGYDFRRPDRMCDVVAEHEGESGLVVWFRYPPQGTFGDIAPARPWMLVCVYLDGEHIRFAGGRRCDPIWVPLAAGTYEVEVRRAPENLEVLAAVRVDLRDDLRVVEVVPAPRFEPQSGLVRLIDTPACAEQRAARKAED